MSLVAFILIVASAALHATWNLIAKKSHVDIAFYLFICMVATTCWLHVQFWTPVHVLALPATFYLFTMLSVLCDAVLYCIGLKKTYEAMEMATAYPIMRATPILLTALVTALFGLGSPIGWLARVGLLIVFAGALLMPLSRFSDFKPRRYLTWGMLFVLLAACGTTGYTVFDSLALASLRKAALPSVQHLDLKWQKPVLSLTYYNLRGILLTATLWVEVLCLPRERASLARLWRERTWMPFAAGISASLTYSLVLLAMNYVTNVSYVQVFRQLGLPFGMLGGVLLLKEKAPPVKWAGVALIITGLALTVLKFS